MTASLAIAIACAATAFATTACDQARRTNPGAGVPAAGVVADAARTAPSLPLVPTRSGEPLPVTPVPSQRPQTVIVLVLDNVRAQSLSACGYDRPTSPTLAALAARPDAAFTCRAYSPGTWTVPAHASFFSGVGPEVHAAAARILPQPLPGEPPAHAVPNDLPMLAEEMSREGYRSLCVSGNPLVSEAEGLVRGFGRAIVAEKFGKLYGAALTRTLATELDRVQSAERLFLFVNIADAHYPYAAVPRLPWVGPRTALVRDQHPGKSFFQFVAGQLSPAKRADFLARYRDAYDYAVFRADRTLSAVMDLLAARGRLSRDFLLIVTSDHGELVGDHDLVSHGTYVYEPIARVPFLVLSDHARPTLTEPWPAIALHDLAAGVPFSAEVVSEVGYPMREMVKRYEGIRSVWADIYAAVWSAHEKIVFRNGALEVYDLIADPREEHPLDGSGHPLRAVVEPIGQAAIRMYAPPVIDPARLTRLRALGYAP